MPSPTPERAALALRRVRAVSRWMDTRFRVPGTGYRFGLDPIISLLPFAGDAVSVGISVYPLMEARRAGVRRRTLLKMAANLGLDFLVGLVPLVGVVPDAWYKANTRNLELMEKELGDVAGDIAHTVANG
ncbi:MAG: DUF4112 domain-containing protein [Phycisphaera sp.]|nr:MAG: DUF4112 domain-containing protein [Phycisphaera sp.]